MIQANELRIGNWLYVSGNTIDTYQTSKPKQVTIEFLNAIKVENEERPDGVLTWFNPIHLTPEILEKCGFEKTNRIDFGELKPCYVKFSFALMLRHESYFIDWVGGNTEIKHLHKLQNIVFALTGEELTFKP